MFKTTAKIAIIKIQSVIKTDLVKVFSLTGLSTFVKMFSGLIKTKIVAVLIGPEGVALIGQMTDIVRMTSLLANGGITTGVTKYIAEYKNSESEIRLIISNGLKISLLFSTLTGIILIIFSSYFSQEFFNSNNYQSIFIVFGFSVILFALNRFLLAIINGYKEFKKYITLNIVSNIFVLIYSLTLIYFFGVYGALLSLVTSQSIILIITFFFLLKSTWFKKKTFYGKIDWRILKKLSGFSILTLATFFIGPITNITVRSFIMDGISIESAGHWEGVNRVSGLVLSVITQALTIYLIPRYSELKSKLLIRKEIINVYKLIIPTLIIAFTILFFLRDLIIQLLFSPDFTPMRDLFLFQFIGDFIKILSWIISIQLISKAMIKTLIPTEIFANGLYILLSYLLIQNYGVIGVIYAHIINYSIYLLLMIFLFRKTLFLRYYDE